MSDALAGRVIVITGGTSGIGRATVDLCAARGAHVIVGDLGSGETRTGVPDQDHEGRSVRFINCDVVDEAAVASLIRSALKWYGRLDVLIACAGILEGAAVDIEDFEVATFDRVLDVNTRGAFLSAKHAVRAMGSKGGVILLVASGAGVTGGSSSYAYGASKAAVHGMGLVLQAKLAGRPIRVNTVAPGGIATPLKMKNVEDVGRNAGWDEATIHAQQATLGDPSGVAQVLAFLASDEADYVRGTIATR